MGQLTQDQLTKIANLVNKETTLVGRKAVRMAKQIRRDGPYLWVEYSDGNRKSIKFLSTDSRDATFASFKEQANVSDGDAG